MFKYVLILLTPKFMACSKQGGGQHGKRLRSWNGATELNIVEEKLVYRRYLTLYDRRIRFRSQGREVSRAAGFESAITALVRKISGAALECRRYFTTMMWSDILSAIFISVWYFHSMKWRMAKVSPPPPSSLSSCIGI
jgi:hypothetical protein